MESQVIREHIEQLRSHHSTESVKEIAPLCFNLTNSPYSHYLNTNATIKQDAFSYESVRYHQLLIGQIYQLTSSLDALFLSFELLLEKTQEKYSLCSMLVHEEWEEAATVNYGIRLSIPESYPQNPPFLAFLDKIYHVNVDPVTGQVHMAILKEDWSSFLNLTAIFSSLDCLLEEPDPQYAASLTLQQEYLQEPDKYAQKVGQMINLCTFRPNTSNDCSREVEIVELNHSSEEMVQDRKEIEQMMNSIPLTEIQLKNKDSFESPIGDIAKEIRIQEREEQSTVQLDKGQVESMKLLRSGDGIYFGQEREKRLGQEKRVGKSKKKEGEKRQEFQEIQLSLRKSDQLIEILLRGCESMESTVRGSSNPRMKQLLETKLEGQWAMVEELLQMTGKLKEKLFNDLKKETKMLLK